LNNVAYDDQANATTGCAASAPIDRLTRVVENAVTTTYCYDPRGNVVQKKQTQGTATDTLGYSYTLADRVATETRPSGVVVRYGHDALGQVNGVWVTPAGHRAGGRQWHCRLPVNYFHSFVRDTLDLSNGADPFDRQLPVPSPYMTDPYK
jgi:YD repeat-containing protein